MYKDQNLFRSVNFKSAVIATFFGMICLINANNSFAQQPKQNIFNTQKAQSSQVSNTDSSASSAVDNTTGKSSAGESRSLPLSAVESPYGLKALWNAGDIVSRLTLLILAVMSVGSWYIIVMKVIAQNRVTYAGKEVHEKQFWQQPTLKKGTELLKENSFYRYISENGIDALMHYEGSLQETIDLYSWVSMALHRALDTIQGKLQSGLAFLGTVGSTAPFVGLFGTVWGIHHALSAISIAGQATLDKVAGPVGEALIMTAIGLATAVPAVLGYNFLVRRNKVIMDQTRNFAADIQTVLLGGNLHNKTIATASEQGKNVS